MRSNIVKFSPFTIILLFIIAIMIGIIPVYSGSNEKDRTNVDEKYKWNLKDIYPTINEWKKDKEKIAASFSRIGEFKGRLGKSAAELKEALDTIYKIKKDFDKFYVYPHFLSDQDTRESGAMSMKQEVLQMETELDKIAAYINPEILSIPAKKMEGFFKSEPGLEIYRQRIDDIQRKRAHTLNEAQEAIIAEAGRINPRRTLQGIHFQAAVVSQSHHPAGLHKSQRF